MKITKKIIMMVLVAATALSGITVSTRKAEALVIENYDSNNHEENTKRIMELLGLEFSPTYSGEDYQAYLKSTLVARHDYNSKTYEIRYLADKDGKV